MLMMLGSSSRFIAAFAEPGPADVMMLRRSPGSIVAFAELAELMLIMLGSSSRFITAFAEPGPADAHDAVQVFWFDCLRGA